MTTPFDPDDESIFAEVKEQSPYCLVNGHSYQLAAYGSTKLFCPKCGDIIEFGEQKA
jgi:hypothetical protein